MWSTISIQSKNATATESHAAKKKGEETKNKENCGKGSQVAAANDLKIVDATKTQEKT